MKKLFLTLCLAATSVAAMADRWVAPSSNTYPDETPLYVTVTIDEQADAYVPEVQEIAAFIDGECRAQATAMTNRMYVLRVRGNATADANKTITIKAMYNGLAYTLSTSERFDGETQTHSVPLALTLQPLLGITVDEDPIEITIGGTYNLAAHVQYQYGTDGLSTTVSPIDETETPLTVTYDAGNASPYVSVSDAGVITAVAVGESAVGVTVAGPVSETGYAPSFSVWPGVVVSLPAAERIVVNPTELTVYVGETLGTIIQEGRLSISILPAEADQGYSWSTNEARFPWDGNYGFDTAGDYQVEVYSTSSREVTPVTVTFHVKEPLSFSVEEDAYVNEIGMIQPKTFNVYMNTNDGFDASLLTVEDEGSKLPIAPFTYEVSALQQESSTPAGPGRYYVTITMTGRYVGPVAYSIYYNGEAITDVFNDGYVVPEVALKEGWQWVSPYAFESGNEFCDFSVDGDYQSWVTDGIIEMRTQEGLLYVDPELGVFGDISQLSFMEES